MLSQPNTTRDDALRLLCSLVAFAIEANGTTAMIRLLAWLDAREEDEGGFLWLAGMLGYRPSMLDAIIRSTIESNSRRRQAIERRLALVYWQALNGA